MTNDTTLAFSVGSDQGKLLVPFWCGLLSGHRAIFLSQSSECALAVRRVRFRLPRVLVWGFLNWISTVFGR